MDIKIVEWKGTLSEKERRLHEMAAVKLKKTLVPKDSKEEDKDNGSYYVEKCHAFQAWLKSQTAK